MVDVEYLGDQHLRVGDATFSFGYPLPNDASALTPPVCKPRVLIDQLAAVIERVQPDRIIELGIFRGGSAALIAMLASPEKMVAVELSPDPVDPLREFLEERGLGTAVVPYYGVDQADATKLAGILDREFGSRPIDFVIDDASHLYEPTRSSFELIFPRLRTGGVYVIEDWAVRHSLAVTLVDSVDGRAPGWRRLLDDLTRRCTPDDPALATLDAADPDRGALVGMSRHVARRDRYRPLSRLALELVHLAAESVDIVRRVEVTQGWIEVERGAGPIAGEPWLDHNSMDLFGSLTD